MKRFLHYALAVLTALSVFSCGKDDPVAEPVNDAPKDMTLSLSSLDVPVEGGSYSLTVTAPSRPTVSNPASQWVTVTDGTYSNYKITYGITVSANTAYEERTATLTVNSGSLSKTVSLKQAAAEKPVEPDPDPDPESEEGISKTLVTKDATDQAKALYAYLYSIYGQKTLSSVMADVNWNHRIADQVNQMTGEYPAMNCYDFIHIYVPANNWINYNDLKPVTEWAEAGGIVSLMWHFNVPVNASTTPGADGSGVTCTPAQTSFRARNVFTSSTWENKWFYQEMDKVAAVLLALQEKGIAAIWRPFHEGAGNATLKSGASWGTAWFWWGYDGAEIYKKLWVTMFDYFASKGIKNLIWVWTTQNYNGDAAQYNQDKDWYPGKDYVDIVARDLYGQDAAANVREFTEIQKAYPGKMVTLGECGKNGDIPYASVGEAWNAGAKWSWFMPWYGANLPDTAWWKSAMGHSAVVSRSEVKIQ